MLYVLQCAVIASCCFITANAWAQPEPDAGAGAIAMDAAPTADAAPPAPATAVATEANPAKPVDTLRSIVQDARAGRWRYAASGALVLLMLALARIRDKTGIFAGDRGGAILVGVLGLFGGLVSALASSEPIDVWLFIGAMFVTWSAIGGWTWFKRVLKPKDTKAPIPEPIAEPAE